MPYKNPKNCMHHGCPALVMSGRFCKAHKVNNQAFRNSKEWKRLRAQVLEEEPICRVRDCNKPSTEVDHIVPYPVNNARWNLQGMCKSHHSAKTRVEVSR